ncbi:MAG TPA: response regulator transcription factor [Cyclobacteriaceae bacterium]|nr:response regulator transcription factor [Cyclobacteriaceae bacterium]
MKLNILVVDDEALVREGLRSLLEKENFIRRVVEAGRKEDFHNATAEQSFDLVLLDFRITGTNGLDLFRVLKEKTPVPKVIMLTGFEGEELIVNMLKSGVNGILYKLDGYREVLKAVKAVMDTGTYFPEKILTVIRQHANHLSDVPPVQLTFHEKELLRAIAGGYTTKQIASLLKMPEATTETYRIRLIKKMHVANTAGLLAYAYRNGIL